MSRRLRPRNMDSLHGIALDLNVRIPDPVSYTPDAAVLISSDLGNMPPLSTLFLPLSGRSVTSAEEATSVEPTLPPIAVFDWFFKSVGTRLGKFLAKMHNPEVMQRVINHEQGEGNEAPITTDLARPLDEKIRYRNSIHQMVQSLHLWPMFFDSPLLLNQFRTALLDDVNRRDHPEE